MKIGRIEIKLHKKINKDKIVSDSLIHLNSDRIKLLEEAVAKMAEVLNKITK